MTVNLIKDLLQNYRVQKTAKNPKRLTFHGVNGYDVYNPTAVFVYNGKNTICARVERRESENSSAVFFYEKEADHFYPIIDIPGFTLQDPFISKITGGYIFGGTEIFFKDKDPNLFWRTKIYYGDRLESLTPLFTGPDGMKDIRLVELADKRIGIFTRPQGEIGGRGKIGFAVISTLQDLTMSVIEEATLLNLFDSEEWGGANEPLLLPDGRIGVLGHIANYTGEYIRHYYPAAFTIDPETMQYTGMKIIAERADFLNGPAKRNDLQDVLFSGGLTGIDQKTVTLYVGVSDCETHKIEIRNPFLS